MVLTTDLEKNSNAEEESVIILKKRIGGEEFERKISSVSLDETEAISNSTFRCLIEEAVKANKSCIIARVQTRDKADFRKKYFHHFYGPNLVKILFKVF